MMMSSKDPKRIAAMFDAMSKKPKSSGEKTSSSSDSDPSLTTVDYSIPSESELESDEEIGAIDAAADSLMSAFESKDKKGVISAMREMFRAFEMEDYDDSDSF